MKSDLLNYMCVDFYDNSALTNLYSKSFFKIRVHHNQVKC